MPYSAIPQWDYAQAGQQPNQWSQAMAQSNQGAMNAQPYGPQGQSPQQSAYQSQQAQILPGAQSQPYSGMGMNPQLGYSGAYGQNSAQPQTMTMMNQGMYGQQPNQWSQAMAQSNQGMMNAQPAGPQGQSPQQMNYQAQQRQMLPGTQPVMGQPMYGKQMQQQMPMTAGQGMAPNIHGAGMPLPQVSQDQYNATMTGFRNMGMSDAAIRSTGWDPAGYDPTKYSQAPAAGSPGSLPSPNAPQTNNLQA